THAPSIVKSARIIRGKLSGRQEERLGLRVLGMTIVKEPKKIIADPIGAIAADGFFQQGFRLKQSSTFVVSQGEQIARMVVSGVKLYGTLELMNSAVEVASAFEDHGMA